MDRGTTVPQGRLVAADCLVAAALAVFALWRAPTGDWPVSAAVIAVAAGVAVRRRWPLAGLGVQLAVAAAAILAGVPGDAVAIAVGLVLYPAALAADPRPAALALGGALAAVLLTGAATAMTGALPLAAAPPGEETFASNPVSAGGYAVAVIGTAWIVGRVVRARRADAAELAQLREQSAVRDERLRIARDVHDIVGHSLSLITMKAAVATHVAADGPAAGDRAALVEIERVSREALDDVRTVLGALRDAEGGRPGLDGLDRLVAGAEDAGLSVTVRRSGDDPVPDAVQAAAYRIVQEALTNAVRHASPRRCTLTLAHSGGDLVITVANPAAGRKPGPGGLRTDRGPRARSRAGRPAQCGARRRRPLHRAGVAAAPRRGGPPMTAPVSVLLADDDAGYRATIRTLLDATPATAVVAEAADGQQAHDGTLAHRPDVVLMDVRMPRTDGLTAIEQLSAAGSPARIIVLTTFDLDEYVYRALRAGAAGFLLKDTSPARLLEGIAVAAAGEALLAPTVPRRLINEFTGARSASRLDGVTPREREVLGLITRGLSNSEIEQHLHLSRGTVKTHIGRLMAKLHARDRAQLVIAGYESGLGR